MQRTIKHPKSNTFSNYIGVFKYRAYKVKLQTNYCVFKYYRPYLIHYLPIIQTRGSLNLFYNEGQLIVTYEDDFAWEKINLH